VSSPDGDRGIGSEEERCAIEVDGDAATPREELDPDFSCKAFRIRLIHMMSVGQKCSIAGKGHRLFCKSGSKSFEERVEEGDGSNARGGKNGYARG
jgi:hypothetical protein